MVTISLIAAMASNRVIGNDNNLPWKLPKEMAYFREKTLGKPVILGRKTFQSFGEKPLPKRPHIVVTRDTSYQPQGVQVAHSLELALKLAREHTAEEIMVIGGGEIYKQSLLFAHRIYLTEINSSAEGNTYFPTFDKKIFKEVSRNPQAENGTDYDFVIYEKEQQNK
ncbi:MAG: dihydrofolate reductase [Alphaproteobacteria bacterium]|jgi:dihydrofolate reductase